MNVNPITPIQFDANIPALRDAQSMVAVSASSHRIKAETDSPAPPERDDEAANLARLEDALKQHDVSLKFHRDVQTGETVVELINEQTGDQVRQIPSEVSLHLAATLGKTHGHIVDLQS